MKTKVLKLNKQQKNNMKKLTTAMNDGGYFINHSITHKNTIYVMSHNPNHDTLLGTWEYINMLNINGISVQRCPDEKVIQIVFELI